ncbi:hypothetical protein V1511DRAFT_497991 [Dipodascopsis uninucleata]
MNMAAGVEQNNDSFSVPSVLDSTQSTNYKWAVDSPMAPSFTNELSQLDEEDESELGAKPIENHQLNHITHLAHLLDKFNMNATQESHNINISADNTTATDFSNNNVNADITTDDDYISDTSFFHRPQYYNNNNKHKTTYNSKNPSVSVISTPAKESVGVSIANTPTVASPFHNMPLRQINNDTRQVYSNKNNSDSDRPVKRSQTSSSADSENHKSTTCAINKVESTDVSSSSSASSAIQDHLTKEDYMFLLKQLREVSRECDARGQLINDLKNKNSSQKSGPTLQVSATPFKQPSNGSTPSRAYDDILYNNHVAHFPLNQSHLSTPATKLTDTTFDHAVNSNRASGNDKPSDSTAKSLSSSSKLESELAYARNEIADLRSIVCSLVEQQAHKQQDKVASLSQISVSSSVKLDDDIEISNQDTHITPEIDTNTSETYEKAIADLEQQLSELRNEILRLKGNSKAMGPNMMPDAHRISPFNEEKLYFKLEMDRVDLLGVTDLGNLVKNILLQLSTPLSNLPDRIMSLRDHLIGEERYMHFANDVHSALYNGTQMDISTLNSPDEDRCLAEMLGRIDLLARLQHRPVGKSVARSRKEKQPL